MKENQYMNKNNRTSKEFFVLLSWGAFLVTLTLLVMAKIANIEDSNFWRGTVIGCSLILSFVLAVHYTNVMLEKEHISMDTHQYPETDLTRSIVFLPLYTQLHADIGRQLLDKFIQRLIQNPDCVGTFGRIDVLVSKTGHALSSPQADIILGGIKIEMLTREQIMELLKRRTAFHRAEKWPEFLACLIQMLLRKELEKEQGWQLTAEDLELLEILLGDVSPLSGAEQNSIRLRLEVGVRKESAGEIAEKVERFNQIALGRAEGPVIPTLPPVATSAC